MAQDLRGRCTGAASYRLCALAPRGRGVTRRMSASDLRIAVIPGDGIGVDVIAEAVKALEAVADAAGGASRIDRRSTGAPSTT